MLNEAACRVRRVAGVLCISLLLSACAAYHSDKRHYLSLPLDHSRELTGTPFFPQDAYQCGPASLAMVLNSLGVAVSPERLQPLVYIPERKGSLQAEMLSAAGHFGYLGVRLPATMDSLLLELSSGHPVVVLQNLGRSWLPVWHYAVAIGYNLEEEELYLRSGSERRRILGFRYFMKTWQRSGYWAMVVVPPGTVPASAATDDYLKAASTLERLNRHDAALDAYLAATRRWPDSFLAWAGTGNAAFTLSRLGEAENAYRRALRLNPEAASVMNNLALMLARQGCRRSALSAIECAIGYSPDNPDFAASLEEIRAAPAGAESCGGFTCRPTDP